MLIVSKKRDMLLWNALTLGLDLIWKIKEGSFEQVKIELRANGTELTEEREFVCQGRVFLVF